jgi:hypothetical protein
MEEGLERRRAAGFGRAVGRPKLLPVISYLLSGSASILPGSDVRGPTSDIRNPFGVVVATVLAGP